jgi:integrase
LATLQKRPAGTFNSLREALSLPAPPSGAKSFWEYPHQQFSKFKVRVHPPDANGRSLRQWAIRARFTLNEKEEEDRSTFGQLEALDKTQVAAPYQEALKQVLNRLAEIERLKSSPEAAEEAAKKAKRMTVADAWARHDVESRTNRAATLDKERRQYKGYFTHLADCLLDELPYRFWTDFVYGLGHGKLLNADGLTWTKLPSKRAEATIVGVVNLAIKLFEIAHRNEGLPGRARDWNPAQEAKAKVKKPNKRRHYVKLNAIAGVWRAADVVCASWARDQLRLFILTGLRHSLMSELQFSEVDAKAKVLRISPHKPGTKRRGADTPEDAPDIRIPLSDTALAIIEARRQYAPDPNGPVWYTVAQPGGRAAADGPRTIPVHSDPRSNWARISEAVLDGVMFGPHDLRRTFAQLATEAGANLMGTSLLMLHSPRTIAQTLNLPDITVDYINTADAQGKMRRAAVSIEKYVLGLLDGSVEPPAEDQELEADLAEALGKEED